MTREEFLKLKSLHIVKGQVSTGSMVPILKVGDSIVVDVGNQDIKRFDIVVIYLGEKLVCHYIWNVNTIVRPKLFQTRSMLGPKDIPVGEEDYLGKVISHRLSLWQKIKILF